MQCTSVSTLHPAPTRATLSNFISIYFPGSADAFTCVKVYQHFDYRGTVKSLSGSRSNFVHLGFNDVLSGYKVTSGCTVTFYEHVNYRGRSFSSTGSKSRIYGWWNDKVSSVKCDCGK